MDAAQLRRRRLGPDSWVRMTRVTIGGLFALAAVVSVLKIFSLG
jgi:hypothetical protein